MHLPHGRALDHSTDRRDEFVGIVAAVLPETTQAIEAVAMYALVAAFWGLVVYLAVAVLAS
jgi:hypothetical protein